MSVANESHAEHKNMQEHHGAGRYYMVFAALMAFDRRTSALAVRVEAEPAPPSATAGAPPAFEPQGADFSRFTHTNPQHARLPCLLCHQRTDNSPRPRRPTPGTQRPR